jgi:xanthine dehydrogenase accessory factor
MRELLQTLQDWTSEGVSISRAVVIRTFGSSPRREGATMVRAADGRLSGSVSGGCVEGATAEHMAAAAVSGEQRVVRFGVSDEQAWDVGLACGGTIDVLVQPVVPPAAYEAVLATQVGTNGGRAVVTPLPEGSPGAGIGGSQSGPAAPPAPSLVVHEDGRLEGSLGAGHLDRALTEVALRAIASGTSGVVELGGRQLFVEAFAVRPRLVVVGAVEVAVALVRLAAELDYETVLIDGRPAFATRDRFPSVDQLLIGWPDDVADEVGLGPRDAVAVLSHDPKFDDPAITEALRRGCRYVGAIGSRKTQRARRTRLEAAGVPAPQLARLRGPIGLDLGGREPAETALAILAEIVAARHAASGEPLTATGPAGPAAAWPPG